MNSQLFAILFFLVWLLCSIGGYRDVRGAGFGSIIAAACLGFVATVVALILGGIAFLLVKTAVGV